MVQAKFSATIQVLPAADSYLQQFICDLHYAPGKIRATTAWLPTHTQPGYAMPLPDGSFITVIEKVKTANDANVYTNQEID